MRIYIESTIPSYVVARPARDLFQAARQQLTRDWWEYQRHEHELFTPQLVLKEIARGEPAMAQRRLGPAEPELTVPRSAQYPRPATGDAVLREVWRIKDEMSAARGHDVHRLFAEARKREKLSGHPVVNLEKKRGKR